MPDPIVSLNEESLKADLRELVRRTVEEMLNGLLDEEADDLVGAERYERTADREAYRAGHYERRLATTSGEVTIRMWIGNTYLDGFDRISPALLNPTGLM